MQKTYSLNVDEIDTRWKKFLKKVSFVKISISMRFSLKLFIFFTLILLACSQGQRVQLLCQKSFKEIVQCSISSTFNVQFFCMKVLSYFHQSQNITREKLLKRLSYEKGVHKTLMKLTPGFPPSYWQISNHSEY